MTRTAHASNPSVFDEKLKEEVAKDLKASPLFVYVIGERGADGNSWCPDCVKSDPIVHEALGKFGNHTILECPVVRADYKGNPNYPYRTHPQLQIKGVPTLIHWTKDGPQERLVEEELHTPEPLAKLLSKV